MRVQESCKHCRSTLGAARLFFVSTSSGASPEICRKITSPCPSALLPPPMVRPSDALAGCHPSGRGETRSVQCPCSLELGAGRFWRRAPRGQRKARHERAQEFAEAQLAPVEQEFRRASGYLTGRARVHPARGWAPLCLSHSGCGQHVALVEDDTAAPTETGRARFGRAERVEARAQPRRRSRGVVARGPRVLLGSAPAAADAAGDVSRLANSDLLEREVLGTDEEAARLIADVHHHEMGVGLLAFGDSRVGSRERFDRTARILGDVMMRRRIYTVASSHHPKYVYWRELANWTLAPDQRER